MRGLGIVALVFAGIVVIAQGLTTLWANTYAVIQVFTEPGLGGSWLFLSSYIAFGALVLGFGILLIVKREVLAARWFQDSDASIVADGQALLRAGLIIVGVLLVAGAVPRLITSGASVVQHNVQEASYDMQLDTSAYDAWTEGSNALIGLLELAGGLALIAWSSRVAGRLWSGRPPSPQTAEQVLACPACGAEFDPDDYADPAIALCTTCHNPLFPQASNQRIEQSARR